MVKRLATSPHDPLGVTDSAYKNQLVVVSVQYGPFNTYIPIRSTTIGKSRVARDPIAMHTSWRLNSDITSVTRASMTFRVVRTNQYNQDLGLIHWTNGNHLESPNEGSSIDHQVTIHLHAQNITMFPTNETWQPGSDQFHVETGTSRTCVTLNGSGIQLAVGPQPLRLRNHNFGLAQRIMVKRLATSRHDPLGITDSACKNQLVVVSVQYGPFNPYIPIRSTIIGKSRVARDPIAMHTSWKSNSDIASCAVAQAKEPRSHKRSKHILRKYHIIRDIVARGDIAVERVASADNVADPLTKPLPGPLFEKHRETMGLRLMSSWL
ncbi:vacuolar amino acid transporter 1-like [Dorcoceras hygrometricum]|uniref:Vacuolar amino acid transporter 1-like n=1 Tax=Dorcoceras hygrometricum TaxID=472368 RepID=A0A2Z7AS98_9LAMI|nr:vacuolar amino acid transporter 1-like [Dorcoceras hygrometricum]